MRKLILAVLISAGLATAVHAVGLKQLWHRLTVSVRTASKHYAELGVIAVDYQRSYYEAGRRRINYLPADKDSIRADGIVYLDSLKAEAQKTIALCDSVRGKWLSVGH